MPSNCLIVVDMQNDFLDRLGDEGREALIRNSNELIRVFRTAGSPVVWIRTLFSPDLSDAFLEMRDRQIAVAIRGTPGAAIHPELEQYEADIVVDKKRYSAFFDTELDEVLDGLSPDEITIAGVNTHACVRTTAIDAYQRDMRVLLASECIDSLDREHARISIAYMDNKIGIAMTNAQLTERLSGTS